MQSQQGHMRSILSPTPQGSAWRSCCSSRQPQQASYTLGIRVRGSFLPPWNGGARRSTCYLLLTQAPLCSNASPAASSIPCYRSYGHTARASRVESVPAPARDARPDLASVRHDAFSPHCISAIHITYSMRVQKLQLVSCVGHRI